MDVNVLIILLVACAQSFIIGKMYSDISAENKQKKKEAEAEPTADEQKVFKLFD